MEKYLNKVIQGDCLEILKELPDKCVDLVLTDPPYGDGIGYGRFDKEIANNEDETINYLVLPEIWRILKDNTVCYLFTNWRSYPRIWAKLGELGGFNLRAVLVVVKNNIGMGYGFRNQHEFCMVLEKGKPTYKLNDFSNIIKMQHINHDKNSHPHEKGLDMIKKMILHTTEENQTVFDPFLGSGTTAVACKHLNRNFIGIEISEKYCEIARQRLSQDLLFSLLFS